MTGNALLVVNLTILQVLASRIPGIVSEQCSRLERGHLLSYNKQTDRDNPHPHNPHEHMRLVPH